MKTPWTPEQLGRIVRKTWVEWCKERGVTEHHKICDYDEMPEDIKDVDNRIGVAVAEAVAAPEMAELLEDIFVANGCQRTYDLSNVCGECLYCRARALLNRIKGGE